MDPFIETFARLHPLVVHFPVGILLVAGLMTLFTKGEKWAAARPLVSMVWSLGAVAAGLACLTGWLLGNEGGQEPDTLQKHQWMGLCTAAIAFVFTVFQGKYVSKSPVLVVYALVTVLFLALTVHLGTSLTHGEDYLTKKTLFAALATESTNTPATDIPSQEVAPAASADIEALQGLGLLLMPVAKGSNYLSVNAVNAPFFSDSNAVLLEKLALQIVWLKLGDTKISDTGLASIAKLHSLTRLYLENTAVTDAGLPQLSSLTKMYLLNLIGTKVSVSGVKSLNNLTELRHLYLFNTQVKSTDWESLRLAFPKTQIDSGGYSVKTLAQDTIMLKAPQK